MRDDRQRLLDIMEAIERVERYASEGRERFERDELVQTWVVHHLVIIGEACRALSKEFRTQNPHDAWVQAAGMRNVIVHEYFGVDVEIVWMVVDRDLPVLKARVIELLG